jgi:pyruvate kinase
MMRAGMDVVRLNFSHGRLEDHLARITLVRSLNKKYRRRIRILGDLEGYRIRIGKLKNGVPIEVKKRQEVVLAPFSEKGGEQVIPFDYSGPLTAIKKGHCIYIDDGNIALVVESISRGGVKARVMVGGVIKEHKGINMPEVKIPFKGLTVKDKFNLDFCAEQDLDFVAQSFVRSKEDIVLLRKYLGGRAPGMQVLAKIENREGIKNIQGIMSVCDGIMVARGDMGVSLPVWEVPIMQKRIIRACNQQKKFVITATQMLESMTESRIPTRAEVTDVANAILDGTNYVMLSAESAVGHDPAGCVAMMNNIIKFTEENAIIRNKY